MRSGSLVLKSRDFLFFVLVSYAVVVSLFLDAGLRNYLVLFAALLGGLLFFIFGLSLQKRTLWAFVLFFIMAMQVVTVGGTGELGTVALTFIFALGYFAIASLLDRVGDKRSLIQTMMRRIIYAFAILSVIQMVTSLAGLPIPNLIASRGLWSYNSFAFEPSHVGRIIGLSMLCYLMVGRLPAPPGHRVETPRMRRKIGIAFLATMLLSGSSLAASAIILVFLLSRSLAWVIVLVSLSFLIWPVVFLIDYEPLQRAALLLSSLGSFDVALLFEADASGASRIAPSLIYLAEASPSEAGFWFGYGDVGMRRFFQGRLPGFGDTITAGFIPGFTVYYGMIIAASFMWVFVFRQANRTTAPLIGFWLIFMSTSPWNTQVFWYGLILIQITHAASRDAFRQPRSGPA